MTVLRRQVAGQVISVGMPRIEGAVTEHHTSPGAAASKTRKEGRTKESRQVGKGRKHRGQTEGLTLHSLPHCGAETGPQLRTPTQLSRDPALPAH